jgi:hypothetical protein
MEIKVLRRRGFDMHIDNDKLRKDLKDYFGTAMFGGSPLAMMDMVQVESASEDELVEIAKRNGFDITDYFRLD